MALVAEVISPSIGRVLWFWPALGDPKSAFQILSKTQPMEARVIFVHDDCHVNLAVTDHKGTTHFAEKVYLLQGTAPRPSTSEAFAEWMPYQIGQANKAKTAEDAVREIKEAQQKQEAEFLAQKEAQAFEARQKEEFEAKTKALLEKSNAPSPLPPPPGEPTK